MKLNINNISIEIKINIIFLLSYLSESIRIEKVGNLLTSKIDMIIIEIIIVYGFIMIWRTRSFFSYELINGIALRKSALTGVVSPINIFSDFKVL